METLEKTARFPYAPQDWSEADAEKLAEEEGLELTQDHWDQLRALQEYCHKHE